MKVSFTYERKEGRTYNATYRTEDPETVYERLAQELISKKMCGCTWIKSMSRVNQYDGTAKITVRYDTGDRGTYIVANH